MDEESNSVLKSVLVELAALKSEINTLKLDSYRQELAIKGLGRENRKQEVQIQGLNADILTTKSESRKLEIEIQNLKNQSCQSNNFVSFTAVTSTDRAYVTGESIVFDNVLRNYGEAYDESGVFTCPVTG